MNNIKRNAARAATHTRAAKAAPLIAPVVFVVLAAGIALGDSTPQALPFAQDWSDVGLITGNDDWSGVPGAVAHRGDGLTSQTGVDPQTVLVDGTTTPVDVNANQTNPNAFTTGGVAEFEIANPTVALQGSGTARAPFLLVNLDTTGLQAIRVSYNLRDVDGSADNAVQPVALHFRAGSSGSFTNVPAAFVADATTGPNLDTLVTPVSVVLPVDADNQPLLQVRVMTTDAAGSDEWVGIDDLVVTGSENPGPTPPTGLGAADPAAVDAGEATLLTVAVTPGTNPTSTGLAVAADLGAIGGSSSQTLFDDGTNGDAAAGDDVFSFDATVAPGTPPGTKALLATITDDQGRTGPATIALVVRSDLVLSQVYGGGGNAGATLKNDFIEILNTGAAGIDVTGWSVQYASATGGSWQKTDLGGVIPPGGYYLVQEGAGGGGSEDLPAPDAVGNIAMSASAGKVALVTDATLLSGSGCPFAMSVLDFVGYGSSADCFEGGGPTGAPSNTTAALRDFGGCTDTNDNAADFATGTPNPRNGASPPQSCVPVELAIHDIQGSGTTSPYRGVLVATSGIVTGLKSNGFFIQVPESDADQDPDTSEGVFVFTSGAPPAPAAAGNSVRVVGLVEEFVPSQDLNSPPTTEISGPVVTLLATGQLLPAAVPIGPGDTDPAGSIEQLERLEGMRVHVASLTVVAPTQGSINESEATSTSNGVFYGVVAGLARPFREPGVEVPDPLPPGSPCCVPRFDANPERLRVDSDGQPGALALEVTAGAVVTGLSGPFDYAFRTFTILPDPPPADPPLASGNGSAVPVRAPAADEFTVASFNLERFFDTVDDPGIGEPVLTATAFDNRLSKASLAVRDVMLTPDILGLEEAENLAALQALAARINSDAVAAGQPDPGYQASLEEGNDIGGIDVGFLVKGAGRVSVESVAQEGKDETYVNPETGLPELLNDRPPLVLVASVQPPSGAAVRVVVIVNHLRSLSDVDDPSDGNRVRHKRRAQAEFLAGLIQARQAADPAERIVSVGDYNAFPFNDGYVDGIGTVKGTPTPDTDVVLASGDLVDPDLVNLADLAAPGQRYSYSFDGNAQVLDQILVTQTLLPSLRGFQYARNDADFPDSFRNDPTRPERISDHDMPVAYFSAISIGDTSPARLWLGLRNIDDQGAAFDVQAALHVNGAPAALGETRCVSGLERPAEKAVEVEVAFGPLSPHELVSGDVLSLEVLTRIGTNPDGTQCSGRGKARGLRLYYDGAGRPSRIGAEITPEPLRDYFLRSNGGDLVLDSAVPGSPRAKHKDSDPVKFAGGNPWVEVGTWSLTIP